MKQLVFIALMLLLNFNLLAQEQNGHPKKISIRGRTTAIMTDKLKKEVVNYYLDLVRGPLKEERAKIIEESGLIVQRADKNIEVMIEEQAVFEQNQVIYNWSFLVIERGTYKKFFNRVAFVARISVVASDAKREDPTNGTFSFNGFSELSFKEF